MISAKLTPEQRLQKAVIDIMANPRYVALSGVLMIGERKIADGVPTACTNGRDEFYGREFVESLNDRQLRFLVLHEVYHKLYRHLTTWRWMFDKHQQAANMACVVGETRIAMGDGSYRLAENVRAGDVVSTPFGPAPVLAVRATDNREVCQLDIHDGSKLQCTPDHRVLTERGYVEVQQLAETAAVYVDARNGRIPTEEPRDHTYQGYCTASRCNTPRRLPPHEAVRYRGDSYDGETEIIAQLGELVAYGLGVLRRLSGRGGDGHVPAFSGQIPSPRYVGDEYKLQLDALVGVAGHVLRTVGERQWEPILESGGERIWNTTRAGRYPAVGEDTHPALRYTDGDYPHSGTAWVSFPPDTAHHGLVTGVEGFEPARVTARRLTGTRRRVYDITTAAQCFIAEGVVVHNCDYVINIKLVDDNKDNFATMDGPLSRGCLDEKYRGWDSAKVFHDLMQNAENGGGGESGGKGGEGQPGEGQPQGFDKHDWEGAQEMDSEEQNALAREIDEAIRQGAMMAGKLGSGGDRSFDDLLETKVDWREALREFITTTCTGSDYSTWRRPNRRYIGAGMYMPSGISEQIGEIVIAPDMSGSTFTPTMMRAIMSEVKGIAETVNADAIRVLYWDTEVCADERYEGDEIKNLMGTTKPMGGGGTVVQCVPDYIAKHQIKAQAVIVLTDGYLGGGWGNWHHPVLWAVAGNKSARPSVGTTIHIEAHDL